MRNLVGLLASSVMNHPPSDTMLVVGLNNSINSVLAGARLSTSLTRTEAMFGSGSSAPGEPPGNALARQFTAWSGSGLRFGSTGTNENPRPSGVSGQGTSSS